MVIPRQVAIDAISYCNVRAVDSEHLQFIILHAPMPSNKPLYLIIIFRELLHLGSA